MDRLPEEILLELFKHLINYNSYKYVMKLKTVCKHWNRLINVAVQCTVNGRLQSNLYLKMNGSKYPNYINKEQNISYIGIYNRSFSSQGEFIFMLSCTEITNEQPRFVRIGLFSTKKLEELHNNIELPFDKPPKMSDEDFNNYWKVYTNKTQNKYYRSDIKFHELWLNDEYAVGWQDESMKNKENDYIRKFFYVRINLKRLVSLIDYCDNFHY